MGECSLVNTINTLTSCRFTKHLISLVTVSYFKAQVPECSPQYIFGLFLTHVCYFSQSFSGRNFDNMTTRVLSS
jgi:hypothetical protein